MPILTFTEFLFQNQHYQNYFINTIRVSSSLNPGLMSGLIRPQRYKRGGGVGVGATSLIVSRSIDLLGIAIPTANLKSNESTSPGNHSRSGIFLQKLTPLNIRTILESVQHAII